MKPQAPITSETPHTQKTTDENETINNLLITDFPLANTPMDTDNPCPWLTQTIKITTELTQTIKITNRHKNNFYKHSRNEKQTKTKTDTEQHLVSGQRHNYYKKHTSLQTYITKPCNHKQP